MRRITLRAWPLACACLPTAPGWAAPAPSIDSNAPPVGNTTVEHEADPSETQEIIVTARRRTAEGAAGPVIALGTEDRADVMIGTSALALVKNLPGITFTSADAYGLDLSDGFLQVRGYRQQELAIMFEGIPLNDGSYGSVTGTAPLNVGVSSNIARVEVSSGSARVSTMSNTAGGGEILYFIAEPKRRLGFDGVVGYGTNNTVVTSATLHTGQIGEDGPRILIGAERIAKDKFTSKGTQEAIRANIKLVQDVSWGDFKAFFSFVQTKVWGYNNTSFEMLKRLGPLAGTDILFPDFKRVLFVTDPANANLPCEGGYSCGELAKILPYDTGQTTRDYIGNIAHRFRLSENVTGSIMGYGAISTSDISISDISTPSMNGTPFTSLVFETRP
ncbi:MAG: TonB-dependent receptor plug domain-containing protein [Acetobacteraceae bacterium]|nr:TonB-dependent receptor plug domain-containing protein [Acetobacteraceae bacterium]